MSTDPADVKMDVASRVPASPSSSSKLLAIGGAVFVLLNLIALYVLHFVDVPGDVDSAATFKASQFVETTGLPASKGDAVSYGSDDVLRNGAGTTAYLDKLTLGADLTGTDYISFAPLGTSTMYTATNIMSYQRTSKDGTADKTDCVVTTVTYDAGAKTLTTEPVDTTNNVVASENVRGLAVLSDTQFVVLTASTSSVANYPSYIVPASIDGTAGTVTLDQSKRTALAVGSATNFVAPLSSTAFVVVHFDAYSGTVDWAQRVRVGSVGSDGTVSFSEDTPQFSASYGNFSTNFGAPVALSGLGSSSTQGFVVPYYTSLAFGSTASEDDITGLCVVSATFTPTANSVSDFTTPVCHSSYRPSNFVGSVALGDNALAMAFHDAANGNALTVTTVAVSSTGASLHFRSSYVFPEVSGELEFGADPYGYSTTPRLRVLSSNRLAVSFLNPALSGMLSVRVLGFSASTMALRELTPVLPVGATNFTLATESGGATGAVTHDLIPVGSDSFLAGYVGLRGTTVHQYFTVVEAFGEPVGVIDSYDSASEASITLQGEAEVSGLTAGKVHYATTSGAAVARDSASTDSQSSEFFYTGANTMLVTTDSRLGVAIDSDTLFLSTAL